MIIDCDSCVLQHTDACDDCVVSFLLAEDGPLSIDAGEARALRHLADEGMVAPLRLVPRTDRPSAAAG